MSVQIGPSYCKGKQNKTRPKTDCCLEWSEVFLSSFPFRESSFIIYKTELLKIEIIIRHSPAAYHPADTNYFIVFFCKTNQIPDLRVVK